MYHTIKICLWVFPHNGAQDKGLHPFVFLRVFSHNCWFQEASGRIQPGRDPHAGKIEDAGQKDLEGPTAHPEGWGRLQYSSVCFRILVLLAACLLRACGLLGPQAHPIDLNMQINRAEVLQTSARSRHPYPHTHCADPPLALPPLPPQRKASGMPTYTVPPTYSGVVQDLPFHAGPRLGSGMGLPLNPILELWVGGKGGPPLAPSAPTPTHGADWPLVPAGDRDRCLQWQYQASGAMFGGGVATREGGLPFLV